MTKRTGLLVLAIFGAILGSGIAVWMAFAPGEVRLTRERIQTLIDQRLPFEQKNITVSNATVDFEGSEVRVRIDVTGKRLGQPFSLSATTIGKPIYRSGSFYFVPSDVEFQDVDIGESDGTSLADRIRGAADRYLPNNEGARNLVADLAPEVEVWLRDRAMQAAETVFSQVPVYTLPNDTKGIAARAVLGEVFVESDELVITFTLWRLTSWVLMAGLAFFVSITLLGAMIRNPSMFVAAALLPGDF